MYYTNKDIRIAMIENDISQQDLADHIGWSSGHMSKVIRTEPLEWTLKLKLKRAINEIKENKA